MLEQCCHAKLLEHLYSDFCCLVFPFMFLSFFSPLKLTPSIRYDLPFFTSYVKILHNMSFFPILDKPQVIMMYTNLKVIYMIFKKQPK